MVLAGYGGVACGWFAGGLVCAAAAVFLLFFFDQVDPDDDLFSLVLGVLASFPSPRRFLFWGLGRAFTRSGRVSDFPLCCGGAAIHVRRR